MAGYVTLNHNQQQQLYGRFKSHSMIKVYNGSGQLHLFVHGNDPNNNKSHLQNHTFTLICIIRYIADIISTDIKQIKTNIFL